MVLQFGSFFSNFLLHLHHSIMQLETLKVDDEQGEKDQQMRTMLQVTGRNEVRLGQGRSTNFPQREEGG